MVIEFDGTRKPTGLEVYDPIEQRRLHVRTPTAVSPTPADGRQFCHPVDTACSIETDSIVFDQLYGVHIHDEDGQSLCSLSANDSARFEEDARFLGLSGPIRVYTRLETTGLVETGIGSIHVTFDEPTTVTIGARSLHEQPAETITTTDEPAATMQAVSALSSALKTTSPERAWPTLRGHPPLIERGDRLEIPSTLEQPTTNVTIEVPATYQDIYAVSPLAFFLGAEIRESEYPAIVTDVATYDLALGMRLEDDVARTLKHIFLLECLVRTEGLYRDDLRERHLLEDELPFDFFDTYHASLTDRLEAYLSVPFDLVEAHIPRWPLTAHVPSTPEGVELLPFVVNELGIVREPRGTRIDALSEMPSPEVADAGFVRSAAPLSRSADLQRAPVFGPDDGAPTDLVVPAVTDESIEHAWFGSQVPRGASKATIEAYQNQLDRQQRTQSIEILLVCNDARMLDEHDVLDDAYGTRDTLPFDIHSEFGVSTDDLASLLTDGGYDFLHYIGHATPEGIQCPDGNLDVRTLPSVDLGVFFLNACQSYEQGLALAERGAFGGVATLGDIVNEHAVETGETMARLLNLGFPLRAALEMAKETTTIGDQYLIVGDGSADIAQTDGGVPSIIEVSDTPSGYDFVLRSYSTKEFRVGAASEVNLEPATQKYLSPGRVDVTDVQTGEAHSYLTWTNGPVLKHESLVWNDGLRSLDIC
ncbi:hypothetical protein [Natronobiforma cellulositropha]|uniref:hypothetical protein n=1 Tax=Natronobiforma cellulositropha TaxID=1679076 RepID=UPI0021D5AC10|nr:hypothetical protein [Natronobiforma cellulositropha]